MGSNIRIVTANEDGTVDQGELQGGKIRIVSSEAASPRRVITVNQHNVAGPLMTQKVVPQEKAKVIIRPAIAPKQESKVQYVRVVGSKPIASVSVISFYAKLAFNCCRLVFRVVIDKL